MIASSIGRRHALLVQRLARWGGRRSWQGATVDDFFIAMRSAAYWLGLPDRSSFGEEEAVGILDWTLRHRPSWVRERVHTEAFLRRQAERGRSGGGRARAASARADASNEAWRPWDAEGVSRRTWYRQRAWH